MRTLNLAGQTERGRTVSPLNLAGRTERGRTVSPLNLAGQTEGGWTVRPSVDVNTFCSFCLNFLLSPGQL